MGRKAIDMTGWDMTEHGVPDSQIIVIKEAPKPVTVKSNQSKYWECKCKICGNIFVAQSANIRNGHTKSCGCKRIEQMEYLGKLKFKDLTGQKFGCLTVLELVPERNNDHYQWLCQCTCGNKTVVFNTHLLSGHTVSCGCIRKSIGEQHINKILTDANIPFLHDKGYFHDLVSDNGTVLRYDFILFQDNKPYRLIEFDGPQHYKCSENGFFSNKDNYERLQYHDALKNEYAHAHNIPLVRIPYQERDHITLEMLLGTKYLIT